MLLGWLLRLDVLLGSSPFSAGIASANVLGEWRVSYPRGLVFVVKQRFSEGMSIKELFLCHS